jgi:hypothetical protein
MGSISRAQVVIAPPPTVGSSNPVSAEPLVTRPSTTPCIVPISATEPSETTVNTFDDYNERTFSYAPPAACPGPWSKVVFAADFTVSAGVQYDRSAQFYLGNATLYRGTTAEPGSSLSPSWHVERDVTDLTPIFLSPQTGIANIQNIVNSTYTGVIYANAELEFYPVSATAPAATVPDLVIPIYSGDPSNYHETTAPLTETVTLPPNTEKLYIDVTAQTDEFWWLSTPNAQAAPFIEGVDDTAFREIDISIDGTPAGIAPNHPYVFTGGVDPYLWIPITGAQTLNLKPYRVDLTPFAGMLDDGNPHTIVLNDINTIASASGGSLVNGDLLVYEDHGSTAVTGAVTSNTLNANPATTVTSNVNLDGNNNGEASILESLDRTFTISGYVNTSQGKVTTTINETVDWSNAQNLVSSNSDNVVSDILTSTVDSTVTTAAPSGTTTVEKYTSNPIKAFITFNVNDDGSYAQTTTIDLADQYKTLGPGDYSSNAQEEVTSTDTLNINSSGYLTGNSGQASTGNYIYTSSNGNNYSSTLTAVNNVLTGVTSASSSSAVTLLLSTTTPTATQGATVTLNATVTPKNNATAPTGYVTFYIAGSPTPTVLGTVPVTSTGATLAVTSLPVGTDSITASYSGDQNFEPQSGINTLTVTVGALAGTFTLGSLSPSSLSLTQGQSGVVTLPITANATFSGTVTLSCTGAPAETSCALSPASITLAPGQTATVSVVVSTTAPNNTSQSANRFPTMKALGGISLAGLCFMLIPRRRKYRFHLLSLLAVFALSLGAAASLTGCGSGGDKFPGTPVGATTVTVYASAGSITQSTTLGVTITK